MEDLFETMTQKTSVSSGRKSSSHALKIWALSEAMGSDRGFNDKSDYYDLDHALAAKRSEALEDLEDSYDNWSDEEIRIED